MLDCVPAFMPSTALHTMAAALLLAMVIDALWGEPPTWLHPVVGMGHYLSFWQSRLLALKPAAAFWAGAALWLLGASGVAGLAWAAQHYALHELPAVWATVVLACLLKPLLAWRMLRREVLAVEAALAQSLEAGRQRLACLVSRDVSALSEAEVRESAIETLAENLNDSVVAPIFWFVLLGLPGAAVYRFANTADAMWGYRGRWEWAGKWAARADDVLSWLPARLTAFLLMFIFRLQKTFTARPELPIAHPESSTVRPELVEGLKFTSLRQEARRTPSPNSGWPMAAMALGLGVRLGKPGAYVLHATGRVPQTIDTISAINLSSKTATSLCLVALAAIFSVAWWKAS